MAAKSYRQLVVDLYNAKNSSLPHALTVDDITFGTRAAVTGESYNFAASIAAKAESLYFKEGITLHYTRLAFPTLSDLAAREGDVDYSVDANVLSALNTALQATKPNEAFTDDDLNYDGLSIARAADPDDSTKTVVSVSMGGNHLKYTNNGVIFKIVISPAPAEKTDLSTTNGELDGFSQ